MAKTKQNKQKQKQKTLHKSKGEKNLKNSKWLASNKLPGTQSRGKIWLMRKPIETHTDVRIGRQRHKKFF